MQFEIRYLKSKGRMPVRRFPPAYTRDTQQDIPVNWCIRCRREIYDPGKELCRRCEGETNYEESGS